MRRSPVRSSSPLRRAVRAVSLLLLVPALAFAQANGKLQIHHMQVGQGDGILLISPLGQTALFDDGVYTDCAYIKSYLQGLSLSVINYHFASHYHADHIGCIDDLAAINITIGTAGYDRGSSYSSATFTNYVNTLGAKRTTIAKNQVITLDAGAANPVLIKCVELNGAGVYSPSGSDENAKSVVLKVSYGAFDEVIAGDLTGSTSQSNDVESTVGPLVGDVEVYKVHHHGSTYSTNDNWLTATTPEVGIIQVGASNSYGHPTAGALGRLHAHGVKTYWTESGAGASPDPTWDKVANGTIVVQADPGTSDTYSVSGPGFNDSYPNGGGGGPPPTLTETLVATSMTMINGSITTGDVTRLAANDAVRVSVGAGQSGGKYLTNWYGSVTLNHPPTRLTIRYDGNYTVNRTQTLYLWNWGTSAWVQVDQASVGTTDVTRTWTTTSPAAYVSGTREVRLRVSTNNRNSSFTCRGDYMAFEYDYLQGTSPAAFAVVPQPADQPEGPVEADAPELPLGSLRRITASWVAGGVSLQWAVDRGAHVDGFNVYREDAAGSRVLAGSETMVGIHGDEAQFRFVDESATRFGATYWLAARACSGPEAMIGPIEVAALAANAAPAAFTAMPSLVREGTSFAFEVTRRGDVQLDIFDVSGRRVAAVFRGVLEAGPATFDWKRTLDHGGTASPGVYFARLQGVGPTQLKRLTVLPE